MSLVQKLEAASSTVGNMTYVYFWTGKRSLGAEKYPQVIVEEASLGREEVCNTHCCQVRMGPYVQCDVSRTVPLLRRQSSEYANQRAGESIETMLATAASRDASSYRQGFVLGSLSIRGVRPWLFCVKSSSEVDSFLSRTAPKLTPQGLLPGR